MGLRDFLVGVKTNLRDLPEQGKLHIVIGNESCDLDSVVSAITYAYFLHSKRQEATRLYIPFLNIPRQKFRIRLETVFFLGKHGITEDDLNFIDDLDLPDLISSKGDNVSVTLVDHHELSLSEECLRQAVVEVLDHRPQAGDLPRSWKVDNPRIGSCCTLVAQRMLAADPKDFKLDPVVAELLLGTTVTDTVNMSPEVGIGTATDMEVLEQLKSHLPPGVSATGLLEEIREHKYNLSSLTVLEMLERDCKLVQGRHMTVVISSITMPMEEVLSRTELKTDTEEFLSSRSANVLVIMTIAKQRGIAVISHDPILRQQISDVLLQATSPSLDLQPLTSSSNEQMNVYHQVNCKVFRKAVLPLIRDFIE